jgi:hypothetical protein
MRQFSRLLVPFAVLIATAVFSCKDKDDSALACGCNGPVYKTVENADATYLGNGYFIIKNNMQGDSLLYGWACEVDTTLQKSPDENTRNYIVSADFKQSCPVNDLVFPSSTFARIDMIEVTAVREK